MSFVFMIFILFFFFFFSSNHFYEPLWLGMGRHFIIHCSLEREVGWWRTGSGGEGAEGGAEFQLFETQVITTHDALRNANSLSLAASAGLWLLAFLGEGGSNFPKRDAEIISRMVKDRISV